MNDVLFHLAFPTHDLAATKHFYVDGLGCTLGRESSHAVTFGLAGYQLVAHLTTEPLPPQQGIYPRHFGLVFLSKDSWQQFLEQAQAKKSVLLSAAPCPVPRHPHRAPHVLSSKILPTICSNSNTTRMNRPSSASETIVRSATRCNLPPAPGLGALPKVGLVLTLVLSLALTLALVLAGEIGEIPE